jgi:hypothetical protein
MTSQATVDRTSDARAGMSRSTIERVKTVLTGFTRWLDQYGETSYDFQSFYASPVGQKAKALYYRNRPLGTIAVAPIILCEALVPSARKFFWHRQRFPIADAHYAMGFATLFQALGDSQAYRRAVHFLHVLLETKCVGYSGDAWGYPFDWITITGAITRGTALITTEPYVYEAFSQLYSIDRDPRWLDVMRSSAIHFFHDYRQIDTSTDASSTAYTPAPDDPGLVVNASAYRAFVLTKAAVDLGVDAYCEAARRNLRFVLASQNRDGSWFYAMDGRRDFVDHFHTCFVLKALAKIERLTGDRACAEAIERGVSYYVARLFDEQGLPLPFAKAPRLTVYRRELYDYAECINLGNLLAGRFPELDRRRAAAVDDLLGRWIQPDGSFKSRQLRLGWDLVPMHRWAQAQTFRSLCGVLSPCG